MNREKHHQCSIRSKKKKGGTNRGRENCSFFCRYQPPRKVGVWLCLTETSGEEEEEGCHGRQLHRERKRIQWVFGTCLPHQNKRVKRHGGRWRQERAVKVSIGEKIEGITKGGCCCLAHWRNYKNTTYNRGVLDCASKQEGRVEVRGTLSIPTQESIMKLHVTCPRRGDSKNANGIQF
ncbi:unnamed protein product [Lactuca saligna]|uniref:Uncharacterized protein n=1 Tax=Lactuca saligna TaxID=75948 RepID=A0AA35ZW09_LACSI|nr:unnamed protein product [Lactuca saligna]